MVNFNSPATEDSLENYDRLRMVVNESVAYHTSERQVHTIEREVIDEKALRISAMSFAVSLANRQSYDPAISNVINDARKIYDFLSEE